MVAVREVVQEVAELVVGWVEVMAELVAGLAVTGQAVTGVDLGELAAQVAAERAAELAAQVAAERAAEWAARVVA